MLVYLHTEDQTVVAAGWVGDEVRDALAAVGGELLEENFCLGFGEGAHCGRLCCVRAEIVLLERWVCAQRSWSWVGGVFLWGICRGR